MPASASTSEPALRRLAERSPEVRAAIVLAEDGSLAAVEPGDEGLGERLRELTLAMIEGADGAEGDPPAEIEVATPAGAVYVVREGATLTVVAGRFSLSSLLRYDVRAALADLDRGGA